MNNDYETESDDDWMPGTVERCEGIGDICVSEPACKFHIRMVQQILDDMGAVRDE